MMSGHRARLLPLMTVAASMTLAAAWYELGLRPVWQSAADTTTAMAATRRSLHASEQQAARYESYRAAAAHTRSQLKQLSTILPPDRQMAELVIALQRSAAKEGVTLVAIRELDVTEADPCAVQSVEIRVRGQFFDVQQLISRLEDAVTAGADGFRAQGRLVRIAALQLTAEPSSLETTPTAAAPTLDATLLLHAYEWRGQSAAATDGAEP